MQVVSSATIMPPEPITAPAARSESKSTGVSRYASGRQPPSGPPVCTALKTLAEGHAPAHVVDDLAQGDAHGHFDQPGALDLAGEGEDGRAGAALGAEAW